VSLQDGRLNNMWLEFAKNGPEKLKVGTLVKVIRPVDGSLGTEELLVGQAPNGTEFRIERSNGYVLSGQGYVVDARNKKVEYDPDA
jgi:hypothetical protein